MHANAAARHVPANAAAGEGDDGRSDAERVYVAECFMCDAMAGPFSDPDAVDGNHEDWPTLTRYLGSSAAKHAWVIHPGMGLSYCDSPRCGSTRHWAYWAF